MGPDSKGPPVRAAGTADAHPPEIPARTGPEPDTPAPRVGSARCQGLFVVHTKNHYDKPQPLSSFHTLARCSAFKLFPNMY